MILLPYKCQVHDLKAFVISNRLDYVNAVLILSVKHGVIADFDRYIPYADELAYLLIGTLGRIEPCNTDNPVRIVQIGISYIPDGVAVEVRPVRITDQDRGKQPWEQQSILQDHSALFMFLVEHIVAGDHNDDASQSSRKHRKDKAQFDAAQGSVVGEHT